MILLNVVDREGVEHRIQGTPKATLMEVLRDQDYGVAALCGGMCSCATCHVLVEPAWLDRLPAMQSDEKEIIGDLSHRQPNSRLSCQIPLKPEYDGLRLTIAPEE